MPLLLLDACSALHLKQLSDATHDAVGVLDLLLTRGVVLASTKKVQQELMEMSLSMKVDAWTRAGRYRALSVRLQERRTVLNRAGRFRPMPGRKDVDLVVLALREGAVLLTHDGPAAGFASRLRVITVDVIDLAALGVDVGILDWPEANRRLERLGSFAWKPDDWAGSPEDTAAARPRLPKLLGHLKTWMHRRRGDAGSGPRRGSAG